MGSKENSQWASVRATVPVSKKIVWEALTLPEHTQKYMYHCQLHTTGVLGSTAVWKAQTKNGAWVDHIKAKVLVFDVGKQLAFEIFHEATDRFGPAVSELHFYLESIKEGTRIFIKQGDFSIIENGAERYASCQQGWEYVLPNLLTSCLTIKNK